MKHILFLSYDGMTDPLGQSQVIPYLSGLSRYGYRFTILSCDKPSKYREHKSYVQSLLKDLPIQWVSIPYHKNPPVLSSIYDLKKMKQAIKVIHQRDPVHMLHTRPGVPTLAALWAKKKFGFKFLNDVRGFWADERVDGGMWDIKNPVYKTVYDFFKKHEYECLERAEYNTCLTYAAQKEMLGWKNLKNQPLQIEVIPCSADLDLFDPARITEAVKQEWRSKLGLAKGDMVISYLGSIGGWYLTEEMMRFCKMFAQKEPAAKFLFISPHRHSVIVEAAEKHGLDAGRIITIQAKRHEVPALLSLSDYSLFFIKPCYSKISSSPTKHGEIMAMGIPVITNSGVGDVKEIVQKYNAGFVVEDFEETSFEKVIDEIISGKSLDREAIRRGAVEFYSLDKAVSKYSEVYGKIFS